MLQSKRDTTRLCAKYIEPRQAKPFDSYSQDELRFRMMQLDCPRELVADHHKARGEGRFDPEEVEARRDLLLKTIVKNGPMTVAQFREHFPDMTQTQIANDLKGMKRAGRVECVHVYRNIYEWRATA